MPENPDSVRRVELPRGSRYQLPQHTVDAIRDSSSHYPEPLWAYRAEKTLTLVGRQWILPRGHRAGSFCDAMPTSRPPLPGMEAPPGGMRAHLDEFQLDASRYPSYPRHLGRDVLPVVDEDSGNLLVGWARVEYYGGAEQVAGCGMAILVGFTLRELVEPPLPLPAEYQRV